MEFHGFQNTLPVFITILLAGGLIALSWFSYSKLKSITKGGRWLLISLRAASFLLVLLLLLNPYFFSSQQVEVNPQISVFLDNSESTTISKNDFEGLDTYRELLNNLDFDRFRNVKFEFHLFDEDVLPGTPDSLNGNGDQSNLSAPVQSILEMDENVKAAILISDGIITYGKNPIVDAFNSSIPIYTIGIGDTSDVRDVAVSNINTNTTGYTNTLHTIEAEINQTGYVGSATNVQIRSGETVVDEKEITFETNNQSKTVTFEIQLDEAGLKQYEIFTQILPGEWSEDNNSSNISVEVIDSRINIVHIAFSIHPDVKALRSLIESDQNNNLYPLTWTGNGRFIEDMPDLESSEIDLAIIHGRPDPSANLPFIHDLSNIPTLFLELGRENPSNINSSSWSDLDLINTELNSVFNVHINQAMSENEHSILDIPDIDLASLPSLFSPRRSVSDEPRANTLYTLTYNQVSTEFPAILVTEIGNIRRGHVLPWGWYKLAQSSSEPVREFYEVLFTNMVSWHSNSPDDRLLRVIPENKMVNTNSNPILNGFLRNERGEAESDAVIEIQLEGENSASGIYNMNNLGEGRYQLELPQLSEGLYTFTASARTAGRMIEAQEGEFLVSNTSNELSQVNRNDNILQAIATNSGGTYFSYDKIEGFWEELTNANLLSEDIVDIENYIFPVRTIYWFILLTLLLGTEWFIRKRYSLP